MSISRIAWVIGVLGALSLGSGCVLDATDGADDETAQGIAIWDLATTEDAPSGNTADDEDDIGDEDDAYDDVAAPGVVLESHGTELIDPHPDPWHLDARLPQGPTNHD